MKWVLILVLLEKKTYFKKYLDVLNLLTMSMAEPKVIKREKKIVCSLIVMISFKRRTSRAEYYVSSSILFVSFWISIGHSTQHLYMSTDCSQHLWELLKVAPFKVLVAKMTSFANKRQRNVVQESLVKIL